MAAVRKALLVRQQIRKRRAQIWTRRGNRRRGDYEPNLFGRRRRSLAAAFSRGCRTVAAAGRGGRSFCRGTLSRSARDQCRSLYRRIRRVLLQDTALALTADRKRSNEAQKDEAATKHPGGLLQKIRSLARPENLLGLPTGGNTGQPATLSALQQNDERQKNGYDKNQNNEQGEQHGLCGFGF